MAEAEVIVLETSDGGAEGVRTSSVRRPVYAPRMSRSIAVSSSHAESKEALRMAGATMGPAES